MDAKTAADLLNELKAQVADTAAFSKAGAKPVELDQNRVGRLSRMDALQGQAMAKANAQRQTQLLSDIHAAEQRIVSGEFGHCIDCDDLIAVARLRANPVVQTCIACASAREA